MVYYGLGQIKFIHDAPALWWVVSEGSRCAVLALALNTAAYTSEIQRGGLASVPVGLVEAAKSCGMSRTKRFRRIEFPLTICQAFAIFEVFFIAAVPYLALNLILIGVVRLVERRLMRHTRPAPSATSYESP